MNGPRSSGRKKRVYIVTALDRATHTFVGWAVVVEREEAQLQAVVDQAPQARAYYSDGLTTYAGLVYGPATYTAMPNNRQTSTVEGGNVDLRHYVARLGRKSRCFSRCRIALARTVKLFIWCYTQRQLWRQLYCSPSQSNHHRIIRITSPVVVRMETTIATS